MQVRYPGCAMTRPVDKTTKNYARHNLNSCQDRFKKINDHLAKTHTNRYIFVKARKNFQIENFSTPLTSKNRKKITK